MKRSSALSGLIGLVLFSFGVLAYVFTSGSFARLFAGVNLIFGVISLIGWAVSIRGSVGTIAGHRTTRYGANAALYTIAFVGALVAVNYLGTRYHTQYDLTVSKAFSLSPESVQVVRRLKKPVKFYGFVEGGHDPVAESLYQEYTYASPLVSYELVDPNRHPELAERYKVATMNTTHIQYGGDDGQGTNVTDMTEEAITNGLVKLTSSGSKTVCFTGGEGEPDPSQANDPNGFGDFRTALQGENYTVNTINLVTEDKVPSDCTVLIVAGPTRPLVPHAIDAINQYLKNGGRALVMLRPIRPDQSIDETALVDMLKTWGVKVGDNIVVDQVVRLFAGPALGLDPLVKTYNPHPITEGFDKQTVFPMVRTVDPMTGLPVGLSVTPLAITSDTSWAETDLDSIFKRQTAAFTPKDRKGPVPVVDAVSAQLAPLKFGQGEARLVVFGDTDFANNQNLGNFFNRDFIMNSVDWLAGEANSITIRPRSLRASRFNLTTAEFDIVFVLSVLLLPEMLLIIGIAVWWERRN
ncbi:MAG TPA: Gldg family protein [Candidatus Binataceae bacterium]|nr:Gldg family protein [Candidatus Binataceae bacterium]